MTESETNPSEFLATILAAVAPLVHVAASEVADPGVAPTARIFLSPFRVDIVFHDDRGRDRRICPFPGSPVLAELAAEFLNEGMAALPDTIRTKALQVVQQGAGSLMVIVEIDTRTIGATLIPVDDACEPQLLFALQRPALTH